MLEYYQVYYSDEIENNEKTYSGVAYATLFDMCKEIVERELSGDSHTRVAVQELKSKFSSRYINEQLDLMVEMSERNPTEAIGKARELLESCCKTICNHYEEQYIENIDLSQ